MPRVTTVFGPAARSDGAKLQSSQVPDASTGAALVSAGKPMAAVAFDTRTDATKKIARVLIADLNIVLIRFSSSDELKRRKSILKMLYVKANRLGYTLNAAPGGAFATT